MRVFHTSEVKEGRISLERVYRTEGAILWLSGEHGDYPVPPHILKFCGRIRLTWSFMYLLHEAPD